MYITSWAILTKFSYNKVATEVARAGEQGKGFAVVAEEIRKLAEQSRSTTAIIDEMVANLVNDAKSAVSQVALSNQILASQKEMVNQTKETFGNIAKAIGQSEQLVKALDQSGKRMETNKEVVFDSVSVLADIAEQNAAATEGVSASMQLQSDNAGQIAKASDDLAKLAQELQVVISQFRV